jgi:hypothetical protein
MNQERVEDLIIEETEPISRILFCPSMVDNGCVSPTAFELSDLPGGPEKYVSLFLLNIFQPTKDNCIKFRARKDGDKLYGHAISIINKCNHITYDGISVLFKRHDSKTAGHIGLHYSKEGTFLKGASANPSLIIITRMIARQFQAIPFSV